MSTTVTVMRDTLGGLLGLRVPRYLLKVTAGPDRRREHRCSDARTVVGTAAASGLRLTDSAVSAMHCEVLVDQDGFRVRDLGSKNGVWLRDRRVREAWLEDGDELALGRTRVRLRMLDEVEQVPVAARSSFGGLRGGSLVMRLLYRQLERAAEVDAPVLLQGETGTGKDLAAQAIAAAGSRRDGPFVVIDCGALTPSLAESELFGHCKGAFSGAESSAAGAFERAHGGTVFLDEIGELPLELQPKLLGVLERRQLQRVGGGASIPIDIRVIAATHRELEREVNRGRFRADLFYRLAVLNLRMPALRERREDVPELIAHFLEGLPHTQLPPAVLERLCQADYPGNVRELRNAVERAAIGVPATAPVMLPAEVDLETPFAVQKERLLAAFELRYLTRLLQSCGGNVSEAARRSGLHRAHLHTLLRELGVERDEKR